MPLGNRGSLKRWGARGALPKKTLFYRYWLV